MKIFKNILFVAAAAGMLMACEQEPDQWLQDNIQEGRGYFPVVASLAVASPASTSTLKPGDPVTLDLRYWSLDPIQEVRLYAKPGANAPETLVATTPYVPAYSTVTRTDSLLLNYQLPAGITPPATVTLRTEVVNQNTLTKSSSVNINLR